MVVGQVEIHLPRRDLLNRLRRPLTAAASVSPPISDFGWSFTGECYEREAFRRRAACRAVRENPPRAGQSGLRLSSAITAKLRRVRGVRLGTATPSRSLMPRPGLACALADTVGPG